MLKPLKPSQLIVYRRKLYRFQKPAYTLNSYTDTALCFPDNPLSQITGYIMPFLHSFLMWIVGIEAQLWKVSEGAKMRWYTLSFCVGSALMQVDKAFGVHVPRSWFEQGDWR